MNGKRWSRAAAVGVDDEYAAIAKGLPAYSRLSIEWRGLAEDPSKG